jgi:hypothetical protein
VKENYILTSILLLSAILRIYHADYQSLWVDEINTMIQSNPHQSFKDTYLSLLKLDLQPPLYFYILKYLFRIFGYTTLILRLFSVFMGIAGVWTIYLLGKELFHKKVGLYAGLILCLNYFHIFYSQEGRPYTFLVLFTILSFYVLVRFIKFPSYKLAIYYGIFSCLMLYGHPIGLFTLLAQYVIGLYYFFLLPNDKRLLFFKQASVSFFIQMLLYIPAIPLLASASKIDSFWIQLPDLNVFSSILKDFFGNSELLLTIIYLMIIFYFIRLFNEKGKYNGLIKENDSELINSYVVLIPWLVICLVFPLIRSYLKVPMIIPRYLIIVLPAVIVMVSIGIFFIKHRLIRFSFLGLIALFSLTDIFVLKDYYKKKNKTDFRGVSNFVIKNRKPDEQVVSRIGFHYSYFFDNCDPKIPVLWNSMTAYIETVTKYKEYYSTSFWFVDAQDASLAIAPELQSFLDANFYVDNRIDLHQAVGIHYAFRTKNYVKIDFVNAPQISGTSYQFIELAENNSLKSNTVSLEKGDYVVLMPSKSLPEISLNNINAHVTVKLNGKIIGGVFLNEKETITTKKIKLYIPQKQEYSIELLFDNDFSLAGKSRGAIIYPVFLEKI